jgi:hypothetical protein
MAVSLSKVVNSLNEISGQAMQMQDHIGGCLGSLWNHMVEGLIVHHFEKITLALPTSMLTDQILGDVNDGFTALIDDLVTYIEQVSLTCQSEYG